MEDRRSDSRCDKMALGPKKTEPKYWETLSAELRLMILEIHTSQKNPGWASCAAVCKEWQFFIEKKNFHRLKLRGSCLDEFKHMVIRQRDLVRHIQFIIELPEYSCHSCETYKPRESLEESVIGDMIWNLLSILATWKLTNGGITLEFNAYSPSDSEHWFKKYYLNSDKEGLEDATSTQDGDGGETSHESHHPKHGWINGQQVQMPEKSVVQNLFEQVDIGPRSAPICPSKNLLALATSGDITIAAGNYSAEEKLSVFEDFNKELTAVADPHWPSQWSPKWDMEHLVNQEQNTVRYMRDYPRDDFVRRIFDLNLEELSIAYMINAEDFFPATLSRPSYWDPFPTGPWERLRSLALTSQLLQPTIDHPETNALLYRAGISAL
ncbi:hypothetical protein VE02_09861 [Pseudogymnoascus sp. 03VT05]|nr:hypothetical protein VE02_09861 [Pseudogymnoascus sp. 03VT05]